MLDLLQDYIFADMCRNLGNIFRQMRFKEFAICKKEEFPWRFNIHDVNTTNKPPEGQNYTVHLTYRAWLSSHQVANVVFAYVSPQRNSKNCWWKSGIWYIFDSYISIHLIYGMFSKAKGKVTGVKVNFSPISAFPDCDTSFNSQMSRKRCTKLDVA